MKIKEFWSKNFYLIIIFIIALIALIEAIIIQVDDEDKEVAPVMASVVVDTPPEMTASIKKISYTTEPFYVNWSYQSSEIEWSSLKTEEEVQAIDLNYPEYMVSGNGDDVTVNFKFDINPSGLLYIRRFNADFLDNKIIEKTEDEEGSSLSERIERHQEYDEYEEFLYEDLEYPYSVTLPNDGDYVYEAAFIWDEEGYRGTAYYSFLVRKDSHAAGRN